jgi:ribonuclease E
VPVEVTSFLLNEKRTEITKIELKQRCTVLLVPNKHLETPNYKLERLRHDDPRLETLQASYTMIEEPDDEVGITRREKSKPKQEPVIKGVLPDQPAPVAAPKPEPVAARPAAPVAAAPAPTVAAPAAPGWVAQAPAPAAGGGFFGMLKRLFGGGAPAPVAAPATAPAAAPVVAPATPAEPDKREGRPDGRRDRPDRGPRGDRGDRGGRGRDRDGKPAEARGDRPERGPRADRPDRSEPRGEGRRDGRRSERPAETDAALRTDGAPAADAPRRTPRPEREPRPVELTDIALPLADGGTVADGTPAPEGTDAAGDEQRRRRRRRGGRGGRDETGADLAAEGAVAGDGSDAPAAQAAADPTAAEAADATAAATESGEAADGAERDGGRRRGRGRDRNRRERAPLDENGQPMAPAETAVEAAAGSAAEAVVPATALAADTAPAAVADAPAAAATLPATAAAPAPTAQATPPAMPAVAPFVLPIDTLQQLAEASGLQWVNSDSEKIQAAQAAMAAEPVPVRVPRERKPLVVIDEGPLVLVETRKDLSQLKLPFEHGAPPA